MKEEFKQKIIEEKAYDVAEYNQVYSCYEENFIKNYPSEELSYCYSDERFIQIILDHAKNNDYCINYYFFYDKYCWYIGFDYDKTFEESKFKKNYLGQFLIFISEYMGTIIPVLIIASIVGVMLWVNK